jgi:hypothetical protein
MDLRPAKILIAIMLIVSVGAHWALLQSAAWVGMFIDYSQDSSLTISLHKTFDGQHPCCLCKAIAEGKKSEKKQQLSFQKQDFQFVTFEEKFHLTKFASCRIPSANTSAGRLPQQPPVPPPRFV